MNQPLTPGNPAFVDPVGGFLARPASQTWEQVALSDGTGHFVWVWFKPPYAPQGLVVRIPEEVWQITSQAPPLTLRSVLQTVGIDPGCVTMWQLYGLAYQGWNGTNPLLDQPIPVPGPGVVADVLVYVAVPQPQFNYAMPGFAPPMTPFAAVPGRDLTATFDRLDTEWNAALDVEKDLDRLRKMMVDLTGRLKSLNRDLSSDERLYSSREDKQDWVDSRRMLRDSEQRLRGCIKDFDIGDSSSAGYRKGFEQIHRQHVVPRIPYDGIDQAVEQFVFYRKLVTTLQGKMNNAYLGAVNNGERRAQQVLVRIAAKVREGQTRKTALGVMLDG